MDRPTRDGKTKGKQTGHSNILGSGASAAGITGNGIAGISGGSYNPAGIGAGPNEDGSAGVPVQASITPVTVKHPILDAIFNRGQGSQFANQANLGISMQQLSGQQGIDKTSLENKGKLDVTSLEGQNKLADTKQVGQNALEQLIEGSKQGRLTNQQVHDLAVLGHAGLTSDAQGKYESDVQPQNVENLSKAAKGEGLLGDIKNNYLGTSKGKANAETGIGAELTSPAAKNQALTKMVLDPGQFGNAISTPTASDRTGFGGSQGGVRKVSSQQRDPNNPLSLTTTDTETRVPGTRGFMQPPPIVDSPEEHRGFLAPQNRPNLGISPSDPTMPPISGIQQPPPTIGFGSQPLQGLGGLNMQPNTGIGGSFVNPSGSGSGSNSVVPNPNELSIMQKLQLLQQQGWPFGQQQ